LAVLIVEEKTKRKKRRRLMLGLIDALEKKTGGRSLTMAQNPLESVGAYFNL